MIQFVGSVLIWLHKPYQQTNHLKGQEGKRGKNTKYKHSLCHDPPPPKPQPQAGYGNKPCLAVVIMAV